MQIHRQEVQQLMGVLGRCEQLLAKQPFKRVEGHIADLRQAMGFLDNLLATPEPSPEPDTEPAPETDKPEEGSN